MELYIMQLKLNGADIKSREIPKLRGFLANKFPEHLELHNHLDDKKYKYGYPLVQYKVIKGTPTILAINNAALTIYNIMDKFEKVNIESKSIDVHGKYFTMDKYVFGISDKMIRYKFTSPWMALNQENFSKYVKSNEDDKRELLMKILTGNLLSMSKYLNYRIEEKIYVDLDVEPVYVNYKNGKMMAFKGNFNANFFIPDYVGLGKSVSRGFGVVEKI